MTYTSTTQGIPEGTNLLAGKLVHTALPVRITHMGGRDRGLVEMACTYDIHPRGARLLSTRNVTVGDLMTVERGRSKATCQVVWTGDPNSTLRGQFTVECVDGCRSPWEDDLRQVQERYLPISLKEINRSFSKPTRVGGQNRRRSPRFEASGGANLRDLDGNKDLEGNLQQISEHGCVINAGTGLVAGTGLSIVLSLCDVSVALKGSVRYASANRSLGVEFQEIRQGDRPLLHYVLAQVGRRRREDFSDLEVVTDMSPAIAV